MAPFKKEAAETAVRDFVKSGQKLGLGTGSTMKFAIELLGAELKSGELEDVVAVSTSERTTAQAKGLGIELIEPKKGLELDLAIDGADEVAKVGDQFFLIKGMGGALLREKAVANLARKLVIVVDDSKLVHKLGTKSPLPVEVSPSAAPAVSKKLTALGGVPTLRTDKETGEPYVTDNGNHIVDVKWADGIDDPKALAKTLDGLRGVKAHGLFLGMADEVVVASERGTRILQKNSRLRDVFAKAAAKVIEAPETPMSDAVADALGTTFVNAPVVQQWFDEVVKKQAAIVDATVVMMGARKRIADAEAKGENPLPPIDRANLPDTEDEALTLLMTRLGLTAAEKKVVERGAQALADGGQPPMLREPIGGRSEVYAETFRTQMAVTDPGVAHIYATAAEPKMIDGNIVHVEIIDRDTEHMAPYSNPGPRTLALVRMVMGTDAPTTAFFGRPNYIASALGDAVPGMDTASAGVKFNLATAAGQMANDARSALNIGYSEAKFGMDGLSPDEVVTLGQAVHAQANLREGEYISAAFNLNALLKDFELVPADAAQIAGAPTVAERQLMLDGALKSIDAAKDGGFKKVTVDSASMKPPSYPLIEFFSAENLLRWVHHAHEQGLETYGSGGMRDYHFPLLQFVGLDGVGVGFSIHEPPNPLTPGKAGPLMPEKVLSAVAMRNEAEKSPVGRAAVLLRMLDERASAGTLTSAQGKLRESTFGWMTSLAHHIDGELDQLKATRDAAVAKAAALSDADAKKAAEGDAKKSFEEGFKALIKGSLGDPQHEAEAQKLLQQGAKLEVKS
ncbi:MAG: ribose-5-phosphate isomerase RpiA [Archangiaceae bacterium]|nr:ribose-5-phosphate isomerase RpiA [Archangiaceae bacterium]